jgi:cytochrome c-type biogenesis protein CcmF
VFIGTFYPLFIDVIAGEKLSVGAPYFNLVFLPFMALALFIIAPASAIAWKRGSLGDALRRVWPAALAAAAALVIALALAAPRSLAAAAGAGLAAWAGAGVITDFTRRVRFVEPHALARMASLPKSYVAMTIAHLGFAVVAIGVLGAGVWKSETIAYAREGDVISVGGFDATLQSVREIEGPNYAAEQATFAVERNGRALPAMTAERRFYPVRGMQTTEAAIATDLTGDLYLTVGEFNPERGWVVRAWRYPLTVWMWIGAGLIALGGFFGFGLGERKRARVSAGASQPAAA